MVATNIAETSITVPGVRFVVDCGLSHSLSLSLSLSSPPPALSLAETSITVDDVVFVVDAGRVKRKTYDAYTNISTFQAQWVSRASASQRRGRAGRCQPGVAFALYSRKRHASFSSFTSPEILESSLEELCLQVKVLVESFVAAVQRSVPPAMQRLAPWDARTSVADFLGRALDRPSDLAVKGAMRLLVSLGALTPSTGALTDLGRYLSQLPMDPRLGKMLLVACFLGCQDPMLTVAAAASNRSPFNIPSAATFGSRTKGQDMLLQAKQRIARGSSSDHIALVELFERWKALAGDGHARRRFLSDHFASEGSLRQIDRTRSDLLRHLQEMGFAGGACVPPCCSCFPTVRTMHECMHACSRRRRVNTSYVCASW